MHVSVYSQRFQQQLGLQVCQQIRRPGSPTPPPGAELFRVLPKETERKRSYFFVLHYSMLCYITIESIIEPNTAQRGTLKPL